MDTRTPTHEDERPQLRVLPGGLGSAGAWQEDEPACPLDATRLAAEIAELASRAGRAHGSTGDDTPGAGLTSRELEVLRLVAAGQSNREIAAALVISPKTASVHVSNILAKLGAATRTEAAVKAHDLGVLAR